MNLLTIDIEADPFADSRWNIITGNAQVGTHLPSANSCNVQVFSFITFLAFLSPAWVPDNKFPILSSPSDFWSGMARCFANKGDIVPFLNHHILACLQVVDIWRHIHIKTSKLLLHLLCVNLTHVTSTICFNDGSQVKFPNLKKVDIYP